MKQLILLSSVYLPSLLLAAIVPHYEPVATFRDSIIASAANSFRITNGYAAATNQFPHHVAITAISIQGLTSICGGSLISDSWIVSAAHCTVGQWQYNLRFGSIDRNAGGIAKTSFHSAPHPSYDPRGNLNYDISLIYITTPLEFNAAIAPVHLPAKSQVYKDFVDEQATVSGWGRTSVHADSENFLRWVHVRVISNARCRTFFVASAVVDHVVCAMGYANPSNQGTCSGDSGGPLTIEENGMRTLIGIVSFGRANGCGTGFPSGYTRAASFLSWIHNMTGIAIRS